MKKMLSSYLEADSDSVLSLSDTPIKPFPTPVLKFTLGPINQLVKSIYTGNLKYGSLNSPSGNCNCLLNHTIELLLRTNQGNVSIEIECSQATGLRTMLFYFFALLEVVFADFWLTRMGISKSDCRIYLNSCIYKPLKVLYLSQFRSRNTND